MSMKVFKAISKFMGPSISEVRDDITKLQQIIAQVNSRFKTGIHIQLNGKRIIYAGMSMLILLMDKLIKSRLIVSAAQNGFQKIHQVEDIQGMLHLIRNLE